MASSDRTRKPRAGDRAKAKAARMIIERAERGVGPEPSERTRELAAEPPPFTVVYRPRITRSA